MQVQSTEGRKEVSVKLLGKWLFKIEHIATSKVGINIMALCFYVHPNSPVDTEQEKWVKRQKMCSK